VDTTNLDDMSKIHAEMFLKAYPEWEEYFSAKPHGEDSLLEGEDFLLIRVPSPATATGRELVIEGSVEISIYFDLFHTHIMGIVGDSDEDYFNRAKQLIDSIINEEIIFGVILSDGKWAGTTIYKREESADIRIVSDPKRPNWGEDFPREVSYTCSWRGTYDK